MPELLAPEVVKEAEAECGEETELNCLLPPLEIGPYGLSGK